MKIGVLAVSALTLACALAAVPALADTLYSTLGPGGFYGGGFQPLSPGEAIGNSFTLTSGATVTDAVLGLEYMPGYNAPITVDIESDSGGLPGSVLASLTLVGTPAGAGLVTFDCSGADCNLAAGTYWLVAVNPSMASTALLWFYSYEEGFGTIAYNADASAIGPWGSVTNTEEAFQINGVVTPEPSSFLLLGSGLLGLAAPAGGIGFAQELRSLR